MEYRDIEALLTRLEIADVLGQLERLLKRLKDIDTSVNELKMSVDGLNETMEGWANDGHIRVVGPD